MNAIIPFVLWSALAGAADAQSIETRTLRAQRLYELGDYPRCEAALRELVTDAAGSPRTRRRLEIQLARVLYLQGVHEEALALARRSSRIGDAGEAGEIEALRLIVQVLLERRRYGEIGPHVEALLAAQRDDSLALFARGVAAAKSGDYTAAIPDLERGARDPDLRRNALLELALAYARLEEPREALARLYAIVSVDPFDAETCHQIGRQLLRVGDRRQVRAAAQVLRYFESLKDVVGASSRDHHLAAAGREAEASLERAARWDRVGDLGRAVAAIERAVRIDPDDPAVVARVAEFWFRQGILAEGEAVLPAREAEDGELLAAARARAAALRASLRDGADPLAKERGALAASRWSACGTPLEALLRAARRQGDAAVADRAARLLLARAPDSRAALEHLVERTRAPELLIPHLHYLGRLAKIDPGARWSAELARGESLLLGER